MAQAPEPGAEADRDRGPGRGQGSAVLIQEAVQIRERQTELDNQTAQLQGRLNGLIAKLEF